MLANSNILPNERELFARMAKGDEAAFADIFFHYIPFLQPHVFKMTRSEEAAQDIIHDTFLSLWTSRERLPEVENFKSYIFTISTNKTYNWLRKEAKQKLAIAGATVRTMQYENTTEETIDLHESAELIKQAVAQLPPQRKLIFQLSRDEGLNHEEIAQRLNISKNTVSNHLTEALRSIKEYLQKIPGTSFTLLFLLLKIYK